MRDNYLLRRKSFERVRTIWNYLRHQYENNVPREIRDFAHYRITFQSDNIPKVVRGSSKAED